MVTLPSVGGDPSTRIAGVDRTSDVPPSAPRPAAASAEPAAPPRRPRSTEPPPDALPLDAARRRLIAEVWIVLGLSLGQSAAYAVISLVAKLTQGPLSSQTATLNPSASPRPYVDLTYQLAGIAFTLVPVALVLWLLAGDRTGTPVTRRLGSTCAARSPTSAPACCWLR